jgi:hypothetical protein
VYDETIQVLRSAVDKSKLGHTDKQEAIRKLSVLSEKLEKDFIPNENFQQVIERERATSWQYGGRTVMGKAKPPAKKSPDDPQLKLF